MGRSGWPWTGWTPGLAWLLKPCFFCVVDKPKVSPNQGAAETNKIQIYGGEQTQQNERADPAQLGSGQLRSSSDRVGPGQPGWLGLARLSPACSSLARPRSSWVGSVSRRSGSARLALAAPRHTGPFCSDKFQKKKLMARGQVELAIADAGLTFSIEQFEFHD